MTEFIAGGLVGLLISEIWRLLGLNELADKIVRRFRARPLPPNRILQGFRLGNRDCNTCLIEGDGFSSIEPKDIVCRMEDAEVHPPEILREEIDKITEENLRNREAGKPAAWNGEIAHVASFASYRSQHRDNIKVTLTFRRAKYFHFLAANARIHEEVKATGLSSPTRKKLVGNFQSWRDDVPPNVVNGLPLNLILLTEDRQPLMVFAKRSRNVAIGAEEIACAANENLHPNNDFNGMANTLSIDNLIERALWEELGWLNRESETIPARVKIIGFGVNTSNCCYSLMGYAQLPISFAELQAKFAMHARDRYEVEHFIPVRCNIDSLCEFIHRQDLYNTIGAVAILTLMHSQSVSINAIDRAFLRLQNGLDKNGR